MSAVVAEAEMPAVEVDEEIGEDEETDKRDGRQEDDCEKVGLFGRELFDFHGMLDVF